MSVAVIIPNYNNEPYIEQCLRSILADPAVTRVVVHDNASQDGSVAVVEGLANAKIDLVRGQENIGAARARHAAIARCAEPYLFFLDGDDYLGHETISAALAQAVRLDLDLSVPEMVRVSVDGARTWPFVPRPEQVLKGNEALMQTIGGWKIHPMGVLARSLYDRATEGFEFHGFSDDELLTRRLFLCARRVGGSAGTYFYRHVEKAFTFARGVAQLRTEARALVMAAELGELRNRNELRRHRNHSLRALAGLIRRALAGRGDARALGPLISELEQIRLTWSLWEFPYWGIARGSRLLARLAERLHSTPDRDG
jgi:glycosyltransferase involved in cell wall biosynthesis